MENEFARIYRELEGLNPLADLNIRSVYISAEGLSWRSPPQAHLSRDALEKLYYFMLLTRLTDDEIELFGRKGIGIGKHLSSAGNEATSVGAGFAMGPEDWFAPAIRSLGVCLVRGFTPYEIMCQACGKKDGPTKGKDGSLHFGDPNRRTVGLISHLGLMAGVASGCAFGMKYKGIKGAALAFSGDGAMSLGPIHEALNIASVKEVPLVLVIENNQWAFGTPNHFEFRCPTLALRALSYGSKVEGVLIDGTNVLTVYGTVKQALERAYNDNVTTIIEAMTMRMKPHSSSDSADYVLKEQYDSWREKYPIDCYGNRLVNEYGFGDAELKEIEKKVVAEVKRAALRVEDCDFPEADNIEEQVFVPSPTHSNPLIIPPSKGRLISYHGAIREALWQEMERNPDVVIFGQEVAIKGGAFGITKGFSEHFDNNKLPMNYGDFRNMVQRRVNDMPIAESGMVLLAAGASYIGVRPVVEFEFADFSSSAFMSIVNFVATQTARGTGPMPIVPRLPSGWTKGASAYHSISPESWFASTPGLKIVAPATSFDAKGLLLASIRDGNPVLFIESRILYNLNPEKVFPELKTSVPEGDYIVPIGRARVLREGNSLTIVGYGSQLLRVLEAVRRVESENPEILIEVIDLRTIHPWDKECVFQSVKKTSKVLVTCEAQRTGCFGQTIVAEIQQNCFLDLDAPVILVAGADAPMPFSPSLEEANLPTAGKLVSAIKKLLLY